MNRLGHEQSPYLLQHADNPVDWYAWGEEAFAHARREDKPIFLSIGYSTCHWCHVMERESFENDAVAQVLNHHFVAIKVDREERPDVDRVYMAFVQATTGSGGWPMSVWLTPDLKPFYGGTYFPPSSRWGRPGFVDILQEIARVWHAERSNVLGSADAIVARMRDLGRATSTASVPGDDALKRTVRQFREAFDSRRGGFGGAPKFPRPSELLFLLREHARTGDPAAREMVLTTLRAMSLGGMRDHIGGGFHRYSVDADWRVPHFEKMLYDQAQLALAYVEAAQVSGDEFFASVAEDTVRYVMREMTDPDGGFYSAEDADSVPPDEAPPSGGGHPHKAEGAFYLWRADEVDRLLGDDAAIVKRRFGIEPGGNAPADPQLEFTGKNLLYVAETIEDVARATGRTEADVSTILGQARMRMYEARLPRPRPSRDDKILTAWNGLMIAAFARTARVIRGLDGGVRREAADSYLQAARRAAIFIRERLWRADSETLLRRYRGGQVDIDGYAEDYAYLIFGLLELFQADGDAAWLEWAIDLQHRQDVLFWDEASGGWFSTTGRDPSVLVRMKDDYDGAEPSASSVSVLNLLVLSHLVEDAGWIERVERTLKLFGERLQQMGRAVPMMAAALSTYTAGVQQIVIASEREGDGSNLDAMKRAVARRYLPFAVTIDVTPRNRERLRSVVPFLAPMSPRNGEATAYVCRDFACAAPTTSVSELESMLSLSPKR
jgi:uncharacterized protein YyaL (SSP411 family)